MRKFVFLLSLLTCFRFPACAQYTSGPQVLTFLSGIDDSDQPYALYLPKKFDKTKRYPLVVMLHGAFSNHRLALRRVFGKGNAPGENDVEATRYFPPLPDVDYIVAAPLARGTLGYQGITEQDVFDVLDNVESRFPIDPDRVYLTGLSMGGGGTLWIGLTHPDVWAAIAPVCPAPPEKTSDLAPNVLNLAVHFFQGEADPLVPVQQTRDWVAKLKSLGAKTVEYNEYPGVKHNSWDNAYANAQIFHWFDGFKRDLWPKRVRYVTSDYEHQKAYWVVVDRLTPGTLASIDAQFTATNQVEVKTSGLGGFSLMLYGHPSFEAGKPLTVTVDGTAIHVPPITSTAAFAKTARLAGSMAMRVLMTTKSNREAKVRCAWLLAIVISMFMGPAVVRRKMNWRSVRAKPFTMLRGRPPVPSSNCGCVLLPIRTFAPATGRAQT